jgi:nucleotide-binding universal stress UspA family protein
MSDWRTICCAVDFSEISHLALSRAADLARRYDAALLVLHAVAPSRSALGEEADEEQERVETERAERQLARWRGGAEMLAGRRVRTEVVHGDPAAEIVRHALRHRCDLLVLGTHGRTGLRRLVLGSVAERVLRRAPCPVLAVRPAGLKLEDEKAEEELAELR